MLEMWAWREARRASLQTGQAVFLMLLLCCAYLACQQRAIEIEYDQESLLEVNLAGWQLSKLHVCSIWLRMWQQIERGWVPYVH